LYLVIFRLGLFVSVSLPPIALSRASTTVAVSDRTTEATWERTAKPLPPHSAPTEFWKDRRTIYSSSMEGLESSSDCSKGRAEEPQRTYWTHFPSWHKGHQRTHLTPVAVSVHDWDEIVKECKELIRDLVWHSFAVGECPCSIYIRTFQHIGI
jgi:hypothetical protein